MSSPTSTFRQLLTTYFNIEELKVLAFDLGVNFENIQHRTRQEMALNLIDYCARLDSIPELVKLCQSRRPRVEWPFLSAFDLYFLKNEAEERFIQRIDIDKSTNIDNSKHFGFESRDITGGTFIQGENIVLGNDKKFIECPDCFNTGYEHETCSQCGGTGEERYYEDPTNGKIFHDISEDDKYRLLKWQANAWYGVFNFETEKAFKSQPSNWHKKPCDKCNKNGFTLLTIDDNLTKSPCPTCKGSKQTLIHANGSITTAFTTIAVYREGYPSNNASVEMAVYIDSKLVGYLKNEPITIKVKKGDHDIQSGYFSVSLSRKLNFDTEDSYASGEFVCDLDWETKRKFFKLTEWSPSIKRKH